MNTRWKPSPSCAHAQTDPGSVNQSVSRRGPAMLQMSSLWSHACHKADLVPSFMSFFAGISQLALPEVAWSLLLLLEPCMCACLRACKRSSVCVQALVYVLRIFNLSCLCASVFVPVHAIALMIAFLHIFSSHAQSRTTIENFRQYTIHCTSILCPLPAVSLTYWTCSTRLYACYLPSLAHVLGWSRPFPTKWKSYRDDRRRLGHFHSWRWFRCGCYWWWDSGSGETGGNNPAPITAKRSKRRFNKHGNLWKTRWDDRRFVQMGRNWDKPRRWPPLKARWPVNAHGGRVVVVAVMWVWPAADEGPVITLAFLVLAAQTFLAMVNHGSFNPILQQEIAFTLRSRSGKSAWPCTSTLRGRDLHPPKHGRARFLLIRTIVYSSYNRVSRITLNIRFRNDNSNVQRL